jgi:hypothetical protein
MPRLTLATVTIAAFAFGGSVTADPKRPTPDYDGRGNTDARPSDAVWIPRLALSPVYLAHEVIVRRPLEAVITTAERDHWPSRIEDLLTFGADRNITIFPTAMYDFGVEPSIGATLNAQNLAARGNSVSLHAATWGPQWWTFVADDRYASKGASEETRLELTRREDNLFVGIGPDVTHATSSRYGTQRIDASETLSQRVFGGSSITLVSGIRRTELRDGTCCGDPSLAQLIDDGMTAPPPGFGEASTTARIRAGLKLDSRAPRPAPGTGVYLEAHGEPNVDLSSGQSWIRYGGEAGVALDLDGRQRVLKLVASAELVDPLSSGAIPFYELAQLGGDNTMSGFLPGWMNGRSVATAGVAYTWPVWVWLDGQIRVSAGNAFGDHFDGFAPRELRLSADVGLTSIDARDHGFELLVGAGTETFEQGARITSFRIAIGTRMGM